MVRLFHNTLLDEYCTGTFVTPDLVMTARHCIYEKDAAGFPDYTQRRESSEISVVPYWPAPTAPRAGSLVSVSHFIERQEIGEGGSE